MANFIDALIVPAVLSTVKKVQHDSDESLRILAKYRDDCARRQRDLRQEEMVALDDIINNVARQGTDAIIFFLGALLAVKTFGTVGGQTAQALISINYMTAPKRQFLKPREWLLYAASDLLPQRSSRISSEIPPDIRQKLAYSLGAFGKATGYENHAQLSTSFESSHSGYAPNKWRQDFYRPRG